MSSRAIAEAAASLFHLLHNFHESIHPHFHSLSFALSLSHTNIYSQGELVIVLSSLSFIPLEWRMFIRQTGHFFLLVSVAQKSPLLHARIHSRPHCSLDTLIFKCANK